MDFINSSGEGALRLMAFAGIFAVMAVLELAAPKRGLAYTKSQRWFTNIAIAGIDSIIVRLMALFFIPLAAVAAAMWADTMRLGVLNWLTWPSWLELIIALILLDLAIYGQHVASHKIPLLWQVHKVHHADVDIDVTTAIRFHPIEIAISMLWKILVVLALGPTAATVVIFEVILNGCAMFNHANIALPLRLDKFIRTLVVTPDFHRVHHSVIGRETNSNYGFSLSIWDRLFNTYLAQPAKGHENMTVGLPEYQTPKPTWLAWSLSVPFHSRSQRATSKTAQSALKGKYRNSNSS